MDAKNIIKKVKPILVRNGVTRADLFGSAARGEMKKKSDVDLLIEMQQKATLFDEIDLKVDLENILKRKVDLVSYKYMNLNLKPYIMKDAMTVL